MAQLCDSDIISNDSVVDFDELDHVPLLSRRKLLLANKITTMSCVDVVIKKEEEEDKEGLHLFHSACSVQAGTDQQLAMRQSHDSVATFGVTSEVSYGDIQENSSVDDQCLQKAPCGLDVCTSGDSNSQRIPTNMYTCPDKITCTGLNDDVTGLKKVGVSICTLYKSLALSSVPAKVKVENAVDHECSSLGSGENDFIGVDAPPDKVYPNIPNEFADDDLDHIVLKERKRMLHERSCGRLVDLGKQVGEVNILGLSEDLIDSSGQRIKDETKSIDTESVVARDDYDKIPAINASDHSISSINTSSEVNIAGSSFTFNQPGYSLVTEATKSISNMENSDWVCSSERKCLEVNSCGGGHDVPGSSNMHVPTLQTSVKVKVEPLGNNDLLQSEKNIISNFFLNTTPIKGEMGTTDDLCGDGIDHMRLQDRIKLKTSGDNSELNSLRNFRCSSKIFPPALQNRPAVSESAKPMRASRPRKRKKTATDSVETAMEEDAPGLLQVLVEQGVSVDEIKLYGEAEDDDALDETFMEESFSELEAVMSKIFFQRNSVLKFAPVRCAKGSKPSYCFACLFSLVEQTRYLQFRKWPVEWGWCRDLQSFIFVFKRHNRLVLERPEYGYATYFFELVDSLPIDWQIKRLVTAMKLTNCGRVNLIENKSLTVGEDLSEGEAKVLMDFGWVPNTGLGTMLNYRDRVIHDRKNEKDTSEWRSKIGKLLVDGYTGGSIILTNIPGNVTKYMSADSAQIKMEL